jgi:HSP20 family protein
LADITEDDKEYLIKAELPEMRKEDVKATVENGVLTISGERKFEKEEKKEVSPSRTRLRHLHAQLCPARRR